MQLSYSLSLRGQQFQALPEKALFWTNQKALLISDLHLGRDAHLRQNGFAMPSEVAETEFKKLERLLEKFEAEKIFILGDFFHSRTSGDISALRSLIKESKQEWILIKGNHDVFNDSFYLDLGISTVLKEFLLDDVLLIHDFSDITNKEKNIIVHGHIHPAYKISGKAKQSIKLPCFLIRKNVVSLPAFGFTTGLHPIKKKKDDLILVCTSQYILPVL